MLPRLMRSPSALNLPEGRPYLWTGSDSVLVPRHWKLAIVWQNRPQLLSSFESKSRYNKV